MNLESEIGLGDDSLAHPVAPVRARGSRARRLPSLGVLVGGAGFAAGLTCVYMAMRHLMVTSDGYCASGGPYQIASGHQCGGGEVGLLLGGILGALVFGGLFSATTSAGAGPGSGMDAGFLMWTALFGTLGFNFLSLGSDPPKGVSGSGGWVVTGVVFELMALGGLIPLFWSAREWVARGGAPEPPMFAEPLVRAKVSEAGYDTATNVPGRPASNVRPAGTEQPASTLPKSLNLPR